MFVYVHVKKGGGFQLKSGGFNVTLAILALLRSRRQSTNLIYELIKDYFI
jgi:hypothetical protein